MSIYNRKMFKRNARNALNSSAGVQNFFTGGTVGNYQTFTSPLTGRTFGTVGRPVGGVRSLQPFDIAKRFIKSGRNIGYGQSAGISPGEFAVLQAAQSANMAGRRVKDPTGTRIGGVLESVLNPAARVAAGGGAFARSLAGSATQGVLGSGKRGDATMGDRVSSMLPGGLDRDFLASQGIAELVDAKNMQTASSRGRGFPVTRIPEGGMAAERIMQEQLNRNTMDNSPEAIARRQAEAEARKQMEEQGIVFSDQETGKVGDKSETEFMAGLIMDDIEAAKQDQRKEDDFQKAVDAADRDEADVDLAKYKKGDDESGDGASGGGGQEGGDAAPSAKEEIERVINSGTKEEQEKTLDGFIKEFMDKAPGYEGTDSGLILAKIGFAMAAGKSPNAIENIASAMSDGADMLIKDKAKKDEFNRQLKLSALQYGLQETGKISAEERLIKRDNANVVEMVVGKGGTTYNGREYGEGESVFITKGDLKEGTFPDNILGTAALTALKNQASANATALKDALDRKKITPEQYNKRLTDYRDAVTNAINAESGIALLEGAMVTTAEGKVTGFSSVVDDAIFKGGSFFGMDLSKNYGDKEEVRNAMRAALQDVIPVTLGATQSANSISNRDVDFLIEAYFGAGALNGGILTFATQNRSQMIKRLQRAADKMRKSQKEAFSQMSQTEKFLAPLLQPGTMQSAAGLLSDDQRRLQEAGLRAGGGKGAGVYVGGNLVTTSIGANRGDDGIIRYNLG